MNRWTARSTTRILSVVLVLALLVLVSGLASAQSRGVTKYLIEVAKLTASDGDLYDRFGPVSISGDTVVVGAPQDDDMGADSGSAYLFERDEGGEDKWGQVAKLIASDGDEGDGFGGSVSISGDTVVVGAPLSDDDSGDSSGSVYVFERNEGEPGNWGQAAKLIASDGAEWDYFGVSVSVSGDAIVVGAWGDADSGALSGSAYVYERDEGGPGTWGQVAKLTASDGADRDYLGLSVSISGETVVVGAQGDDDMGGSSGSVYVFVKPESGWPESMTVTAKLTASDGFSEDVFGRSVSISGDTLIVGATRDGFVPCCSGWAYLFERPESGWTDMTETAKLTPSDAASEYDLFGGSVSISGDTVLVGASADDSIGSAYIFVKPDAGWTSMTETVKLSASDGAVGDRFGGSVSVSGDTLVVGASWDDDMGDASGSAYVFGPFEPVAWVYLPVVVRSAP